jgi:ectoine hydroxylase-related dioxygenase (phytanoyl-CoA dioxygenase family)
MLTDEQVQFFHDNGYVIARQALPQRDLDTLRDTVDTLQADALEKVKDPAYLEQANRVNKDWIEHPKDHYVYREKPDGSYSFHRIERCYEQHPTFRHIAASPRLLKMGSQILGGMPFWPRGGSLVAKLPHEGAEVRWHQDIPYLYWSSGGHPNKGRPTTHPVPNFNIDIYLEPSNAENGCLWAIPATHKEGTVDVDAMRPQDDWKIPGAVPLEVEPGDIVIHHMAVVHGSPENKSPAMRRTFYIHYMNNATVEDAYSDWPNILPPDEAMKLWQQALDERLAAVPEDRALEQFEITPEGFVPKAAVPA